jgi:hypothetical protein
MENDEAFNRIEFLEQYIYRLEKENSELTKEVIFLRHQQRVEKTENIVLNEPF